MPTERIDVKLFNRQKDPWEHYCEIHEAVYIKGNTFKSKIIKKGLGNWTAYMDVVHPDESQSCKTRIRVPFKSTHDFYFKVGYRNFFVNLWFLFVRKNSPIGHPLFDWRYFVISNDQEIAKRIFTNDRIVSLLFLWPIFNLGIKMPPEFSDDNLAGEKIPEGADILQFSVSEEITDEALIQSAFDLAEEILNSLREFEAIA